MSLIRNKKATLNFEIIDKFEAGVELFGFEVKSIRNKRGSLDGSYVKIRGGEAFLVNAHIPSFQPTNSPESFDPYRTRKLLLNKKELHELTEKEKERGLTLVPLSMYNKGRLIKLEFAVARGKKKYDKRQDIKRRDTERDIKREFKARLN